MNDYEYLFLYLCDYFHFIKLRIHGKLIVILLIFKTILLQLLHYYNYKNDRMLSYLKPFEIISGLVSPKSIGILNEAQIYKIIRICRILFFPIYSQGWLLLSREVEKAMIYLYIYHQYDLRNKKVSSHAHF